MPIKVLGNNLAFTGLVIWRNGTAIEGKGDVGREIRKDIVHIHSGPKELYGDSVGADKRWQSPVERPIICLAEIGTHDTLGAAGVPIFRIVDGGVCVVDCDVVG